MNKARGKSGPLFNFDVHDDVRLVADATIEKDEVRSSAIAIYSNAHVQSTEPCWQGGRASLVSALKTYISCLTMGGEVNMLAYSKLTTLIFVYCQVFDPEKNYGKYTIA